MNKAHTHNMNWTNGMSPAINADNLNYEDECIDKIDDRVIVLNDVISSSTGNMIYDYLEEYGYYTGGDTVDINSPVSTSVFDCVAIPCLEGDVFTITGKGGTSDYLLWDFIGSDGTQLTFASQNANVENEKIIAPENATHLVVNAYRDTEHYIFKGSSITESLEAIDELIHSYSETIHEPNGDIPYPNALNNAYVWIINTPIPANSEVDFNIVGQTGATGTTIVYFLKKNPDETFTVLDSVTFASLAIGNNKVHVPSSLQKQAYFIGFYSSSGGISYRSQGITNEYVRIEQANVSQSKIPLYGTPINLNFHFSLSYVSVIISDEDKAFVTVDASGNGDYTSLLSAMQNEPENTIIFIKPGVYDQDMEECLKKRVIVIGADRNQCIIRDKDGRYGHHALYISCGYFENLTIIEPYISGQSQEVGISDLGAYAVHIDTDSDYAVGKKLEFHHCTISSDFFPAIGAGLRKDMTLLLDNCELSNGQIYGRGDYSDEGTLGALYVHDSNGVQGDQYLVVKDCLFKSKLGYAMCLYQVDRSPQNNAVHCDFINNVLFSSTNKYVNTVWLRGDPFNISTGIFDIGIGYGNSIAVLNNQ